MLDLKKMLFTIPKGKHDPDTVRRILSEHPEICFVSLVGIDIGGHDTDEKIPVGLFMEDMEKILAHGVQTDGSSVVLPKIAALNNAKVDIIPDAEANWYVDYNLDYLNTAELPVGTLRIPSFLIHNDTDEVGSRVILRDACESFKRNLLELLKKHPEAFGELPAASADEIEEILLTSATELEFWVKTPDDKADREQLSTAQILKEQYWKRTIGPVRTALEKTLLLLDCYGFNVEMGHKEVGGVKAKMGHSGRWDHVMEQLEIDWKYADPIQAADNENQVKYVVKDSFRHCGLDVTFMAKPIDGVAGSGEHTHLGVAARLKSGKVVNLFAANDMTKDFLSPVGYGALMGLLRNYEVINPFVSSSNDAFNRLKPGYEAPVCIVTSLGHSPEEPSRNRTILVGLVRDVNNPLATRFELRAPNPKSNTYLVLASCYMAMLHGIEAALEAGKSGSELEKSLSKGYGEEDFYLERDRQYRSEKDVFEDYSEEEREKLFGRAPATVWENIAAFERNSDKIAILERDGVMSPLSVESYKIAVLASWATELHNRIIPNVKDMVRDCVPLHKEGECTDLDKVNWQKIQEMRVYLAQDSLKDKSLLTRVGEALDEGDYEKASRLQLEMQRRAAELTNAYASYKKNIL